MRLDELLELSRIVAAHGDPMRDLVDHLCAAVATIDDLGMENQGIHLAPTAKVVWRRPALESGGQSGMGLRFLKLARDAARLLQDYVYERARPEDLADELAAAS